MLRNRILPLAALTLALVLVAANCAADDEVEKARYRWEQSPHGAMLERILPPSVDPKQLPEPRSAGARLAATYCVQCHYLPNPAMHNAAKWKSVVERMVWRMEGKGNLGRLMQDMMAGVKAPGGGRTGAAYALPAETCATGNRSEEISRSQFAARTNVQHRLFAVPCAARSATAYRAGMAAGGRAHAAQHGVGQSHHGRPGAAHLARTQHRGDHPLPATPQP